MKARIVRFLKNQWREWRGTILFVVFILVPVKSSLADWNWVPTGSMNPTIVEGDLVYVNKLAYDLRIPLTLQSVKRWSDPERGDISVLFSPVDDMRLVKRVIGVPGDQIAMKNNMLYINGERLGYSELSAEHTRDLEEALRRHSLFAEEDIDGRKHAVMSVPAVRTDKRSFESVTVPEGHYFVMGDNRDLSKDSRSFGFVGRKLFIGEATNVIVSFNMLDMYQPRFNRFFTSLN
ncbi:signal peptidase I [Rubellicoccus peritrichatus]|uniref:Signal peptidase I n=1 Tax=Rubellicoccus peritrichatus TaxID=3080537 RepID=A0AAQ3LCS6_9BACT|nr:signal peptidase I [Puniceicoccus sp. CR14]WOO43325.1 signal peptidase I [Puniceicoccus sp. CR14]